MSSSSRAMRHIARRIAGVCRMKILPPATDEHTERLTHTAFLNIFDRQPSSDRTGSDRTDAAFAVARTAWPSRLVTRVCRTSSWAARLAMRSSDAGARCQRSSVWRRKTPSPTLVPASIVRKVKGPTQPAAWTDRRAACRPSGQRRPMYSLAFRFQDVAAALLDGSVCIDVKQGCRRTGSDVPQPDPVDVTTTAIRHRTNRSPLFVTTVDPLSSSSAPPSVPLCGVSYGASSASSFALLSTTITSPGLQSAHHLHSDRCSDDKIGCRHRPIDHGLHRRRIGAVTHTCCPCSTNTRLCCPAHRRCVARCSPRHRRIKSRLPPA